MREKREVGALGEMIALDFLIQKGYSFVTKNYRKPWGEIDLVVEKGDTVHFVEVKTVSSQGEFSREKGYLPEELAHMNKLAKVARTASLYMEEKKDSREFQIDVVGVILDMKTRKARCRLFEQALG